MITLSVYLFVLIVQIVVCYYVMRFAFKALAVVLRQLFNLFSTVRRVKITIE